MMSQPFEGTGSGRRDTPVTGQMLEDRINVYISAMDRALSMNDISMSSQLQRDIQQLVDLMEKVQSGQAVTEKDVPPPLVMTPMNDVLANPLGELSSRLSDYHKALYFAEEELSEGRISKIQTLQKGLQTIHSLQKRAHAGFPIREDEVPPPVSIPSDSEFDENAVKTITDRLEQYNAALKACEESTGVDRRRIPKIKSGIRTLEFLLTRAKAKRPVWRKDIPAEFEYWSKSLEDTDSGKTNKAKTIIQLQSLVVRLSKVKCEGEVHQNMTKELEEKVKGLIQNLNSSSNPNPPKIDFPYMAHLIAAVEKIEEFGNKNKPEKRSASAPGHADDLALIETRLREYKAAALKAKQEGRFNSAIKHLKVFKGLKPMKETLEGGGSVDITLVPPPPKDDTPVTESSPPFPNSPESNQPTNAHAQLTDIDVKPTVVESDKSKLARKLASYLEVENEAVSPNSTSSSSFDSDSVPSPQEGTPRENSEPESLLAAAGDSSHAANHEQSNNTAVSEPSPTKVCLSNIGFVSCDNRSSKEDVPPSPRLVSLIAANVNKDASHEQVDGNGDIDGSPVRTVRGNIKSVVDTKGVDDDVIENVKSSVNNITQDAQSPTCSDLKNPKQESAVPGGHLASIGFLSCQNVPSFSHANDSEKSVPTANTYSSSDSNLVKQDTSNLLPERMSSNSQPKTAQCETDILERTDSPADFTASEIPGQSEKSDLGNSSLSEDKTNSVSSATTKLGSSTIPCDLSCGVQQSTDKDQTLEAATISKYASRVEQAHTHSSSNVVSENETLFDNNQSDNIVTKQTDNVTNLFIGHGDYNSATSVISGGLKTQENSNDKSDKKPSKDDSFFDPQDRRIPSENQTVGVNGFTSDSPLQVGGENLVSSSHLSSHEDTLIKDEIAGVEMSQQKFEDISVNDAQEFEDLINSMSLSLTTDQEASTAPIIPTENSTKSSFSAEAQLSLDKEHMKESCPQSELPIAKLNFSSLPHQNHRIEKETSENSFHSLPTSFSTSQVAQRGPGVVTDAHTKNSFQNMNSSSTAVTSHMPNSSQQSLESNKQLPPSDLSTSLSSNLTLRQSEAVPSLNTTEANLPVDATMKDVSFAPRSEELGHANVANSSSSPFTCLETLKYDILVAEAKNTEESKKEAEKLGQAMGAIKDRLRKGRRKVWEEYKNRVEYELQVLNNGVKQCGETQNWEEYKYLNSKRMLNEKELALLNKRISEIQD